MKFIQKDYLGTKQILKFPDHAVAMSVTVSDAGVTTDEYGEKIVRAGTIVGGNGVILDPSKPVSDINLGIVAANHTTTFSGANSNLVFTAREKGTAGNSVKVALVKVDAIDQKLAVAVANKVVTVNLATDSAKAIITTANDVIEIIMENIQARTLVDVKPAPNSNSSGLVGIMVETALTGGTSGSGGTAEGVLMNDVDVTYGNNLGAMIIHGFIDVNKLPAKPSPADIKALSQITFLG